MVANSTAVQLPYVHPGCFLLLLHAIKQHLVYSNSTRVFKDVRYLMSGITIVSPQRVLVAEQLFQTMSPEF